MYSKKAVILLSGGIDSATTAAIAINEGFRLFAITFVYGQKHTIEINFAKQLVRSFKIKDHIIIEVPTKIFSSSSLSVESNEDIPKNRDISFSDEIPSTYVPGRNILFLSYALAYAESIDARDIFIGVNQLDYSGYPDCRPEFIKAFENMANIGTKSGTAGERFSIHVPLIDLKKWEIIRMGINLGVDYSITHSCYDPSPNGLSCGECDSCQIRIKGFIEASVLDPTKYKK
ncbi:MAG: 7-cyano-7-deazaguanine synthase QueC [Spirochaetota bacterium]|nr:7-cyano-7-deazaguanine synthase QueC [Spirochaetota bacterium]